MPPDVEPTPNIPQVLEIISQIESTRRSKNLEISASLNLTMDIIGFYTDHPEERRPMAYAFALYGNPGPPGENVEGAARLLNGMGIDGIEPDRLCRVPTRAGAGRRYASGP